MIKLRQKSGHIPALFYLPKKEACMSKITEQVETIIQPILDDLKFELVEIEYVKEGKDRFLRVSIDKEGGVDLNDCTLASEKLVKQWMKMTLSRKCITLM